MDLKLENIHASYGKKQVLNGVSISIQSGEIVAIIGPNGAGKSTLLKVAAGFLTPTKGRVWLNHTEITSLPPHQRSNLGLGYLIQGGRVFPALTVRENLEMGIVTLPSHERDECITSVLELFPNLKGLLKRRAGLLSGGERQALALGMLLVRRPRILLLDEPSAGLSPRLVRETTDRIKQIAHTLRTPVLLVEQRVGEVVRISDRVYLLSNGQIATVEEQPEKLLRGSALDSVFFGIDISVTQET